MRETNLVNMKTRLAILERRVWLCQCVAVGLGLMMMAVLTIAATATASKPTVVQATHLEVVDTNGQVVVSLTAESEGGALHLRNKQGRSSVVLHATEQGGRLEVLNREGSEIFSVGRQIHGDLPGQWERHLRQIDKHKQELDRLIQDVRELGKQLLDANVVSRLSADADLQRHELDRQRRELEQLRRVIDRRGRDIDALERQLRHLDRR